MESNWTVYLTQMDDAPALIVVDTFADDDEAADDLATSALPVAERRAFLLRGREIQQRLKAAGRLAPAQDWIAAFDAALAKLPAAN